MQILLIEAVSAGLCRGDCSASLLREGAAMWQAVATDLAAVPGIRVKTCLEDTWRGRWPIPDGVSCDWFEHPAEWAMWWSDAVAEADAGLIIAPETAGLLRDLCQPLSNKSPQLNCDVSAIQLCSDKWLLAEHCVRHKIPTIPTVLETFCGPPAEREGGWVIKTRDGAGGELLRRVRSTSDWRAVKRLYPTRAAGQSPLAVRQPWIDGQAVSIAGLFGPMHPPEWFPVAEQNLQWDQAVTYMGGSIPAEISPAGAAACQRLAEQVSSTIPGLRGYVGFDVLLPDISPDEPLLVEINPRVTTSYVGYRQSCRSSLMARWLTFACARPERPLAAVNPLEWSAARLLFAADGTILQRAAAE
jgi:tyramine---L-glutamate ligase